MKQMTNSHRIYGKMYYLTLTYDDNWLREGQYAELLRYGPDAQRWVTTDSIGGQVSAVTHYHGDFEMRSTSTGGVSMYHYLGNGLLCVTIANSQPLYYYMMTDNIGSVVHVVNGEGISEFDAWYDAWGRQTVSANGIGFFRGYGGHEMLPQFRLVNMDGRMYDYVLGRFLSPDNYVQEPENSQNFNRYSYCLNNPLKYTDPTGELFGIDDILLYTVIAGGIMNWGMNGCQSGWKGVGAFFVGATTSAFSYYGTGLIFNSFKVSGIISGAGIGGLFGGVIGFCSNSLLGGLNNWINGKGFFNHLGNAAFSGLINGIVNGAVYGGTYGYDNAKERDLNRWWGNRVKPNRSPWNIINNDVSYKISFKLPYISKQENDCLAATYAEIAEKMGSDYTYGYFTRATGLNDVGAKYEKNYFSTFLKRLFNVEVEDITSKYCSLFDSDFMREQADQGNIITVVWKGKHHIDNVHYLKAYPYAQEKNKLFFRQSIFNSTKDPFEASGVDIFIIRKK